MSGHRGSRGWRMACLVGAMSMTLAGPVAAETGRGACNLPERTGVDEPFAFEIAADKMPPRLDYGLVYYRNVMNSSFKTVFLKARADGQAFVATIPGQNVSRPGIELYVVAYDKRGKESSLCFTKQEPGLVHVDKQAPVVVTKEVAPAPADATAGAPESVAEPAPELLQPRRIAPGAAGKEDLAQEFSMFTHETEAKVTSASRVEQNISRSPSTITVITEEDIRNYGSDSIVDVLRTVPGMDFLEITHNDKELNVRGFNREGANKLLVLIDGRSVYVDMLGITFWEALPISVEDVARIEVIRGPASTLYGANAYSGVVSIFTKHPEDIKGALYRVQGGPYGQSASVVTGNRTESYGYKVTGQYKRLASYDNADTNDSTNVSATAQFEYYYSKNVGLTLRTGVEKDRINKLFSLIGNISTDDVQGYAHLEGHMKDFSTQFAWSTQQGSLSFNVPLPTNCVSDPLWFSPSYQSMSAADRASKILQMTITAPPAPDVTFVSHTFDYDLLYSHEFASIDRLSLGASYRGMMMSATGLVADEDSGDTTQTSAASASTRRVTSYRHSGAAYIQNELYPVDWFSFTSGFRYDIVDAKGNHQWNAYSPRGALIFMPNKDHNIRVSGGLSFRTPAFFESSMQVDLGSISTSAPLSQLAPVEPITGYKLNALSNSTGSAPLKFYGNPNLGLEKLYSVEMSYGGRFAGRVEANVDVFYNWYRDLILFQGDPEKIYMAMNPFFKTYDGFSPFNFNDNVNANNSGVEASLSVHVTSWLKGFANYSFQHIWVTNPDELKRQYANDKNSLYSHIPGTYTVAQNYSVLGRNYTIVDELFEDGKVPFSVDAKKVKLSDVTTIQKESPAHKANIGLNTQYKNFRANLFGHFVSETERQTFLTNLVTAKFMTFVYSPNAPVNLSGNTITGSWFQYQGQSPAAVFVKKSNSSGGSVSTLYGIQKIPAYFQLNANASYALFDGKMEIGVALLDLLHLPSLWQDTGNNGFKVVRVTDPASGVSYLKATGIASPRYVQYPRQVLFGQVVGGETMPTRIYFFVRGQI